MCSCSRIALRCGEVDARRSGGDGGASATLARDPDLVSGPLARPFDRHVLVVGMHFGIRLRVQLDESLDLEPVRVQKVDPVAVTELELDLACVRPLDLRSSNWGRASCSPTPSVVMQSAQTS